MSAVKRFIATTDFQRTTGLPIQGKSEKLPNLPSLGRFFCPCRHDLPPGEGQELRF